MNTTCPHIVGPECKVLALGAPCMEEECPAYPDGAGLPAPGAFDAPSGSGAVADPLAVATLDTQAQSRVMVMSGHTGTVTGRTNGGMLLVRWDGAAVAEMVDPELLYVIPASAAERSGASRHEPRARALAESLHPTAGRCIVTFVEDLVPRLVAFAEAVSAEARGDAHA